MKKVIYLAGNISSDPETYKWREKATEMLSSDYLIFNPAANKFNKKLLKDAEGDVEEFVKKAIERSQGILITKDFNLVQHADLLLANMSIVTPDKPMVGTLFELAWAWYLRKPVVAIISDNLYCKHPFTKNSFSATTSSLEEACMLIKLFFVE